jgi:hypothetical protein
MFHWSSSWSDIVLTKQSVSFILKWMEYYNLITLLKRDNNMLVVGMCDMVILFLNVVKGNICLSIEEFV